MSSATTGSISGAGNVGAGRCGVAGDSDVSSTRHTEGAGSNCNAFAATTADASPSTSRSTLVAPPAWAAISAGPNACSGSMTNRSVALSPSMMPAPHGAVISVPPSRPSWSRRRATSFARQRPACCSGESASVRYSSSVDALSVPAASSATSSAAAAAAAGAGASAAPAFFLRRP